MWDVVVSFGLGLLLGWIISGFIYRLGYKEGAAGAANVHESCDCLALFSTNGSMSSSTHGVWKANGFSSPFHAQCDKCNRLLAVESGE